MLEHRVTLTAPDDYRSEPAIKVHWWIRGPLEDILKLKSDCRESDQVTIDPETDLATWSFTVYATSETQWQTMVKGLSAALCENLHPAVP